MNRSIVGAAGLAVLFSCFESFAQQPLGTAFTYQGRLDEDGRPVSATADLRFRLFDAESAGNLIGQAVVSNQEVVEGLFTASVDFGAGAFNGDARWLEVATRIPAGSGSFNTLTPRQPLTAAPYARFGAAAPWSGLTGVPAGFADGIDNGSGDGHSLDAADGSPTDAVFVDNSGRVGINTQTPLSRLHLVSGAQGDGIRLSGSTGTDPGFSLFDGTTARGALGLAIAPASWSQHAASGDIVLRAETGRKLLLQSGPFASAVAISASNNIGIGTTTPAAKLHIAHGDLLAGAAGEEWIFHTRSDFGGDFLHITDSDNGAFQFQRGLVLNQSGNIGIGTTAPGAKLHVMGTTRTTVLEITGADLAEKFPVSEQIEPGMVVAIDPESPGKLCMARGAYNRCVAGVVSGANDFSAGAVLGNLPGLEDAPAIALTGRVWVRCDATSGAIEPGDLLTTSGVPGHAMKVTDFPRAQGATIGKAMSALAENEAGLVLVLVNLQ